MSAFAESMGRMAVLTDEQMGSLWHWRPDGDGLQIRDFFHRSLEAENAQATAIAAMGVGETAAAFLLAQRAAGDLCGLLVGQPEGILDREPAPGEWSLRETMRHIIETEAHFRVGTLWAVDKAPEDPFDLPHELQTHPADVSRDPASMIASLLDERTVSDENFARLTADDLAKPAMWAGYSVDARFRMHRHASHLAEHTNQCEKVLHAIGQDPGEARQLARAIWAARGGHERLSDAAALWALDDELAARVKSFGV